MRIRKRKRLQYNRREIMIFLQARINLADMDYVPWPEWIDKPDPHSESLAEQVHDCILWPLEAKHRLSLVTGWSDDRPQRIIMSVFAKTEEARCLPRHSVRVQKATPDFLSHLNASTCVESVEVQMINFETDEISPPPKWLREAVSGLSKVRLSSEDFYSDRRKRDD